jgi:heterogeneous nuclear ribonucleoprotein F/H
LGVEDNSNDGGFPDQTGVLSWALGQPPPTQTLNNQSGSESSRGKGIGSQSGRGAGRGGPAVRRTGGGIQVGEHTGFIRMRGLPFSSTKEDIINFFVSEGLKVIPDSIVLTFRGDGRATGEGYVGFESPEDSKAAMGLHRNTMGSRYIELFISNKEEHSRAFSRFGNK